MRPAEVQDEQIIVAGKALLEGGRNITGFALRKLVGGGNPSRLKQVWDEYIARQAGEKAAPMADLPVEVAQEVEAVAQELGGRIHGLAMVLNDLAIKAAERRAAEVVRAAGDLREQAERELADATTEVEGLEARIEATEQEREGLAARLAEAQGAQQRQAVELAQVTERLAQIEQQATAWRERAERAEGEALERGRAYQHQLEIAAGLNAKIEALSLRAEKADDELAHTLTLLEDKRAAYEAITAELEAVKGAGAVEVARHQEQRQQAAQEALRAAELLNKAHAERDDAIKEAREAREAAAELRGQHGALQEQTAQLTRALAAASKPRRAAKAATEG